MAIMKCKECSGKLQQDGAVFVCKDCGAMYNQNEVDVFDDCFRITENPTRWMRGFGVWGIIGQAKDTISVEDSLIFESGSSYRVHAIKKGKKHQYYDVRTIETGSEARIFFSGDVPETVAVGDMVYKKKKGKE
ncbi:MAG: hypothetical protein IJC09_00870 [Clostridia bacterium]|nr:hypothetical protein [Clostridia bacterium]